MRLICITILLMVMHKSDLVIGDSLSCYTHGWQDQVAVHDQVEITNLAKGGKRTAYMLQALQQHLAINATYQELYIYGGINDAFSNVNLDTSVANLMQCAKLAQQHGIRPIMVMGYDPKKVNIKTGYAADLEKRCRERYVVFQKKLLAVVVAQRIDYIPMDPELTRDDSDDGIHLNASGHKKFGLWVITHKP